MDRYKTMKRIIIISIIVLIVIIVFILILLKNINNSNKIAINNNINKENSINDGNYVEDTPDLPSHYDGENDINRNIQFINSTNEYFIIKNIIETYNGYRKKLTTSANDIEVYKEAINEEMLNKYKQQQAINEQEIAKEAIYNMLSLDYINEYKIQNTGIKNKFQINNVINSIIEEAYFIENSNNVSTYFVYGKNVVEGTTNVQSFSIAITLDKKNNTFCIYPQEYVQKHFNNIKLGNKIVMDISEINTKTYNSFIYKNIDNNTKAQEYFNNYKQLLIYDIDKAYNMLESEYSKARFSNKQEFEEYINENKAFIDVMQIDQYKIDTSNKNMDYVCTDRNGKYFLFRQKGAMLDYSVILDDYTIISDELREKYNNATVNDKSKYQVDTFIKKVNNKDYKAIYSNLDNTFKNNNFKTINAMKEFIKNNFYDLNSIAVKEMYEEEQYNLFKCEITNLKNADETKQLTVVISIKDGMNYTMSFSFE